MLIKNHTLSALVLLLLTAASLLSSCKKDADSDIQPGIGSVNVAISNVAGTSPIALDGTAYTTASGETFTVKTLEYYISNIKLSKADGTTYAVPSSYYLVNVAKPSSQQFTISNVPTGDYTGVSFVVGVDSTTTKADPLSLTGDLNPANNMYWAWASGHIFMKLEGTVTSVTPNKALTCHIGGYRAPYSAIVTATPSLNGNTLQIRAERTSNVQLTADVLKMFDGANHIALNTFVTTMEPSATSVQLANNYAAGMFKIQQVSTN
jgi:hypothetical protein